MPANSLLVRCSSLLAAGMIACTGVRPAPKETHVVPIGSAAPPSAPSSAPPADEAERAHELFVEVPVSGDVTIDGAPVADDALREAFAKTSGDRVAIIRASDATHWARVVRVLDAIRSRPNRGGELVLAVRGDARRRSSPWRFPDASKVSAFAPPPEPLAGDAGNSEWAAVELGPSVFVAILRDGQVLVDGKRIERALRDELRVRMPADGAGAIRVIIAADVATPFGSVVDATRHAQALGATVAYAVSPTAPRP